MTASSASEAGNREFLLFTSYCGQDNPECSDAKPCPSCLGMSNVFRCAGPMTYVRELAPEWNNQAPPVREDLAAKPSSEIERLRAEVEEASQEIAFLNEGAQQLLASMEFQRSRAEAAEARAASAETKAESAADDARQARLVIWDLQAERDALKARLAVMDAALADIAKMKAAPIGDTGFQTGPLALFQAAQRRAREARAKEAEHG